MITIPHDCLRGNKNCIALSNIASDDGSSFFCCGENNGKERFIKQDKYTFCFKGEYRDEISHNDKRDLIHNSSVLVQALAVIEKAHEDECDWSAWS